MKLFSKEERDKIHECEDEEERKYVSLVEDISNLEQKIEEYKGLLKKGICFSAKEIKKDLSPDIKSLKDDLKGLNALSQEETESKKDKVI